MSELIVLLGLFVYSLSIPKLSIVSVLIVLPIILFWKNKKFPPSLIIDLSLVFLFVFLYYFISVSQRLIELGSQSFLMMGNFCMIYILGYLLSQRFKRMDLAILFPICGLALFAILSCIHELGIAQSDVIYYRAARSFWTPQGTMINGTAIGIFLSVGIGLISFIFTSVKWYIKSICLLVAVYSFYANSLLLNRTPIYTGAILIIICLLMYLFRGKFGGRKTAFLFIFTLLSYFIFTSEQSSISASTIFQRTMSEGMDTPRYQLWQIGLAGIIDHPFGGAQTNFVMHSFAHNLWLDIGWYAGIAPLLVLIIFQARHIPSFVKLFKQKREAFIIIGVLFSFTISFFVEPIMIASPVYLSVSFYFLGYMKGYTKYQIPKYTDSNQDAQRTTLY